MANATGSVFPPTRIVVHPKERPSKCTVEPLRGKPGFLFRQFPLRHESLEGYVLLGLDGPLLNRDDADRGLLVLDGTWRLVRQMQQDYRHVPVRSLPACKTAYPRVSKTFPDPPEGLATIEAIYVAYRILGRSTDGLLDGYRWADEFLRRNPMLTRPSFCLA